MILEGNCQSEVGAKSGKSAKPGKWQKHMASLHARHELTRKEILAQAARLRAQVNGFIFSNLSAEPNKQTATEDQEGLLHALFMLLNRLGHSLAGRVGALTALCCGKTALSGKECSPGGRLPFDCQILQSCPGKKTNPVDGLNIPLVKAIAASLALMGLMYANDAKGDILLGDIGIQGNYSIVEDATTEGYDIMCTIMWNNISDPVPANNQISANGLFGEADGLYKIDTDDIMHDLFPPTYTINSDSFNIAYGDGNVNTPNDSDTFKFYFNLGDGVTSSNQAQSIVDNLNDIINNPTSFTGDQAYLNQRTINGQVTYDGITPKNFENSPNVYVIPEPMSVGLLGIGAGMVFGIRRLKQYAAF